MASVSKFLLWLHSQRKRKRERKRHFFLFNRCPHDPHHTSATNERHILFPRTSSDRTNNSLRQSAVSLFDSYFFLSSWQLVDSTVSLLIVTRLSLCVRDAGWMFETHGVFSPFKLPSSTVSRKHNSIALQEPNGEQAVNLLNVCCSLPALFWFDGTKGWLCVSAD